MTSPAAGDPLGLSDLASHAGPVDAVHGQAVDPDGRGLRNWRRSLGWSATSAPVALLLVAGITFGPHGINLLSPAALSLLDPGVPVALAGPVALSASRFLVRCHSSNCSPRESRL